MFTFSFFFGSRQIIQSGFSELNHKHSRLLKSFRSLAVRVAPNSCKFLEPFRLYEAADICRTVMRDAVVRQSMTHLDPTAASSRRRVVVRCGTFALALLALVASLRAPFASAFGLRAPVPSRSQGPARSLVGLGASSSGEGGGGFGPCTVVGGGRIGSLLMDTHEGNVLVGRDGPMKGLPEGPIYVSTRNDALDSVIERCPNERKEDLGKCFLLEECVMCTCVAALAAVRYRLLSRSRSQSRCALPF